MPRICNTKSCNNEIFSPWEMEYGICEGCEATVKIYNIKKAVEEAQEGKKTPYDNELAIIEGTTGVIVTDYEGVHDVYKTVEDNHKLQIHDKSGGGFSIIPAGSLSVPVKVLQERCEIREEALGTFIRHFGRRMESNYSILLKSIKEIGLDPEAYPRQK